MRSGVLKTIAGADVSSVSGQRLYTSGQYVVILNYHKR